MSKKKLTVKEILDAYQEQSGAESDAAFARLLDVKRQSLFAWKAGEYQPQLNWLRILAFLEPDNWKGRMAVELLDAMGYGDQAPTVVRNPQYREADEAAA